MSLDKLSDKQNMLLTQISYSSDILHDEYKGLTFNQVYRILSLAPDNVTDKKTIESTNEFTDVLYELIQSGLGDLKFKDFRDDAASGFGAVSFEDPEGNVGFSFRGTDGFSFASLNDWIDNIAADVLGTSVQTAQAEAFFDKNKDANGNNYLYGHSKGGNLAESVFVNNYMKIKQAHVLNPQPINSFSLTIDQKQALNSDKFDPVVVEGDYVWFLGLVCYYDKIRIAKSNGKNSHLYESLMFDGDNIIPGEHPWWEYPAYVTIASLLSVLQKIGSTVGFLYNLTVRIIDFIKEDLVSLAKEFIAEVADYIQQFISDVKDKIDSFFEFCGSLVDNAVSWFRERFDNGYKYAGSNPCITVDTYRLKNYAGRLRSVNNRISSIDRRMDSLYTRVGFLDLWNLICADLLTSHSWRLDRCIGYLENTANEFERIENELSNAI